jgi:hypothetical protein
MAKQKALTEHQEQAALFKWAALQQGTLPVLRYLYAIPNGGKRNIAVAAKLKAEGVKPGVPDLALDVAARGFHGLRIEMKRVNASPSDVSEEQRDWHKFLTSQGYCVRVCRGWLEGRQTLLWYLEVMQ